MMRPLLLILFLSCIFLSPVLSQKVLQMEKYGKLKTTKYFIGDKLVFQLKGDDYWYHETIQDIYVNENTILFTNRVIKVDQIVAIKSYKNRNWSRNISTSAYVVSGTFVGLSLLAKAANVGELSRATINLPGVTIIAGWLIRKIFKSRKYKIGNKRRLRLLDLNFHSTPYRSGP